MGALIVPGIAPSLSASTKDSRAYLQASARSTTMTKTKTICPLAIATEARPSQASPPPWW